LIHPFHLGAKRWPIVSTLGKERRQVVSRTLTRSAILLVLMIVGFALFLSVTPVSAESVEEGPLKRNGWTISVAPYLWALSLDGELAVKEVKTDVSVPFRDLVKELNQALMLDFVVHKGRLGLFVNPFYARLKSETTQPILETAFRVDHMTEHSALSPGGHLHEMPPVPSGSQAVVLEFERGSSTRQILGHSIPYEPVSSASPGFQTRVQFHGGPFFAGPEPIFWSRESVYQHAHGFGRCLQMSFVNVIDLHGSSSRMALTVSSTS
jgi:hypothetical protein